MEKQSKPSFEEQLRDILNLFEKKSQTELATMMNISNKTLERNLKRTHNLNDLVKNYKEGRTRYYFIANEDRQPSLGLIRTSKREEWVIWLCLKFAEAQMAQTPLYDAFKRLMLTVNQHMEAREMWDQYEPETLAYQTHYAPIAPTEEINKEIFDTVIKAMETQRILNITYHTASSGQKTYNRPIEPIVFNPNDWCVVAWCHMRRTFLDFKLARIKEARITSLKMEHPPFDREQHFKNRFRSLATQTPLKTVVLQLEDRAIPYFKEKQYTPGQQLYPNPKTGYTEVRFPMGNLEETRSFVQSWGTAVTVLEPSELREKMKLDLETLQARYQNES